MQSTAILRATKVAIVTTIACALLYAGQTASAQEGAPAQPTGLTYLTVASDHVTLKWDDVRDDSITGYRILRREIPLQAAGTFTTVEDNTNNPETTYTDHTVNPATEYVYRIKAINEHGTSPQSPYVNVTTPQSTDEVPRTQANLRPTSLTATLQDNWVIISWNPPAAAADEVTGYEILRRQPSNTQEASPNLVNNTGNANTSYVDPTANTPGEHYVYWVKAIRGDEKSSWSNQIAITLPDNYLQGSSYLAVNTAGRDSATATYTVTAAGTYSLRYAHYGTTDWMQTLTRTADDTTTALQFNIDDLTPNQSYVVQASSNTAFSDGATQQKTFTNRPAQRDIILAARNLNPNGATTPDGKTVWIADATPLTNRIFAYDISTGQHLPEKSFDTPYSHRPSAAFARGDTLWVAGQLSRRVRAYNISSTGTIGELLTEREISLVLSNASSRGMWGNNDTIWLADVSADQIYAYSTQDNARLPCHDFHHADFAEEIQGLWSDGVMMFAVDGKTKRVIAFDTVSSQRWTKPEFALDPNNNRPRGIWGNDDTIWVLQDGDIKDQAFAYYAPHPEAALSGISAIANSYSSARVITHIAYYDGAAHTINLRYRRADQNTWSNPQTKDATRAHHSFDLDGLLVDHAYIVQASTDSSFPPDQTLETELVLRPKTHDIDLTTPNGDARGIWADGETLWVANDGYGDNNRMYAYDLDTGQQVSRKTFDLNKVTNGEPSGVMGHNGNALVTNKSDDKVFAYSLSPGQNYGQMQADKNFSINHPTKLAELRMPHGIWANDNTAWLAGNVHEQVYAHNISSNGDYGARLTDRECDLFTHYSQPNGMWSDGHTLWIADSHEDRIFAYAMSDSGCGARQPLREIRLAPENNSPWGIWSDGHLMWVADPRADKIYAYYLPPEPAGNLANVTFDHYDRHKTRITVHIKNPDAASNTVRLTYSPVSADSESTVTNTTTGASTTFDITDLEKGTSYLATIQLNDEQPAPTGFRTFSQDDGIQDILLDFVEDNEAEQPWTRETYNFMRREAVPVKSNPASASHVTYVCYSDGCNIADYNIGWYVRHNTGVTAHELAHVYTASKHLDDESNIYVGIGWIYHSLLAAGGSGCDVAELYADTISHVEQNGGSGYFVNCSNTPSSPSAETEEVISDTLDYIYPNWFIDRYEADNLPYATSDDARYDHDYDLEKLYADLRATTGYPRTIATNNFKNEFGGYCKQGRTSATRNPWQAGGCVPQAPGLAAEGGNTGAVSLTWSVPAYDGGSPITSYQLQWKGPNQEFHIARSIMIDKNAVRQQTLPNIQPGSSIRLTAHNQNGAGQSATLNDSGHVPPPTNLIVTRGASSIAVRWMAPSILPAKFRIQWKTTNQTWQDARSLVVDNSKQQAVITGANPQTTYQVRVIAETILGFQTASQEHQSAP